MSTRVGDLGEAPILRAPWFASPRLLPSAKLETAPRQRFPAELRRSVLVLAASGSAVGGAVGVLAYLFQGFAR